MNRLLGILMLFLLAVPAAMAQSAPDEPKLKVKYVKGYYRFVDEYGDTCRMTILRDVVV